MKAIVSTNFKKITISLVYIFVEIPQKLNIRKYFPTKFLTFQFDMQEYTYKNILNVAILKLYLE